MTYFKPSGLSSCCAVSKSGYSCSILPADTEEAMRSIAADLYHCLPDQSLRDKCLVKLKQNKDGPQGRIERLRLKPPDLDPIAPGAACQVEAYQMHYSIPINLAPGSLCTTSGPAQAG
jgi:hypothetical protein